MPHPDLDTLLRYVTESCPDEEYVWVDAHLAECDSCLEQVRLLDYVRKTFDTPHEDWSLAQLRAEAQAIDWGRKEPTARADPALVPSPVTAGDEFEGQQSPPGWIRQHSSFWLATRESWAELGSFVSSLNARWVVAGIGIAAVVLAVVVFAWQFRAPGSVKIQVADLGGFVQLTTRGQLRLPKGQQLPPQWRTRMQELLEHGAVAPVPSVAGLGNRLQNNFARLSTGTAATNRPLLLAPVTTSVLNNRPTFRWRGVAGADRYRVLVTRDGKPIWESDARQETELRLPAGSSVLRRGEVYSWQVEAETGGDLSISDAAMYYLLDESSAREVELLLKTFGHSTTVMVAVYLAYGLFDEAETELKELERLNPKNPAVARMRETLRSRRTGP